jgi:hypothetical protein
MEVESYSGGGAASLQYAVRLVALRVLRLAEEEELVQAPGHWVV